MSVCEILLLGDPRLYERAAPVERDELSGLVEVVADLHDTLLDFRRRHGAGRAVAAPQIGVPRRLVYMHVGRPTVFVNPVLEPAEAAAGEGEGGVEPLELWDDCMSFPDLLVRVRRSPACTVRYRDLDWVEHSWRLEGDFAELLQHEVDHLDGVLAVDRAAGAHPFALAARRHLLPARPDLAEELLGLARVDEETRERLVASGELFAGYAPEMERVHSANARRLGEILDETGRWPGRSLVGAEAGAAAWRVAVHAIGLPSFQRRCRALLETAVARAEAPPQQLAYLVDRIRFNERRAQVYGTIHDFDEAGELSPWTIEDPERVEERRRRSGLEPLAEVTARQRERAAAEGHRAPGEWAARQREIEAWARRVGWVGGGGGAGPTGSP